MRFLLLLVGILAFFLMWVADPATVKGDELGHQAMDVLNKYCRSCHGVKHEGGNAKYDISNLGWMKAGKYIVDGKPEQSKIYKRITSKDSPMPPEGKSRPSAQEIELIARWIRAGAHAPEWEYESRKLVSETWVRNVIREDLTRKTYIYFSLAHLYNSGWSEEELAIERAALSKALNSLHLQDFIIIPKQIDDKGLVYRVDRVDLDWENADFQELLDLYPYHEAKYYIRSDWFVANALVPPLYYDLLGLPQTDQELRQALGIDTVDNFLDGRVIRAGIVNSRVTNYNRVLERNATQYGMYWQSFDFKNQTGNKDIINFPLGPSLNNKSFPNHEFAHDGKEIIFTLPDGLHGYFVVNGVGNRLDKAPEDVVTDPTRIAREGAVIPGLGCIACHSEGMQNKLVDSVRDGFPFGGTELDHVYVTYKAQNEIDSAVDYDTAKYREALVKVIKPFVHEWMEPVRLSVEKYNQPLTLQRAATELAIDPAILHKGIILTPQLQRVGLRPLTRGGTISRESWETKVGEFSPAQEVVRVLSLYQE